MKFLLQKCLDTLVLALKMLVPGKNTSTTLSTDQKKTLTTNSPDTSPQSKMGPLWYNIACAEIGVREISGALKNEERILEYDSVTKLKADTDEIPWCSAFVCWCLEKAGIKSTRSAWARSYLNWGDELKEPRIGAICVFSRDAHNGHVGFLVNDNGDYLTILGGNQKDSVCVQAIDKSKLLSMRYPRA